MSIGTGWVEAGENERARPLLASAVKYGTQCRGCISKARRLAEVASLQHRAGDVEGAARTFVVAREAVNELDGAARIQARAYLAQLWHAAGGEEEAQGLLAKSAQAAGLLKGLERAEALAAIADAQALVGNVEQAGRALERLARAVAEVGPDAAPILAASQLTAAVADIVAGRLGMAEETLALVHDGSLAVSGYVSLARGAHAEGDVEGGRRNLGRAVELAEAVTPLVDRLSAWREIRADCGRGRRRPGCDQGARRHDGNVRRLRRAPGVLPRRGSSGWTCCGRPATRRGWNGDRGAGAAGRTPARRGRDGGRTPCPPRGARGACRADARRGRAGRRDSGSRAAGARARLEVADALRQTGEAADALARVAAVLAQVAAWGDDLAADRDELMRQAAVIQAACGQPDEAVKTVEGDRCAVPRGDGVYLHGAGSSPRRRCDWGSPGTLRGSPTRGIELRPVAPAPRRSRAAAAPRTRPARPSPGA